jgi:hypothetical protein
MNLTDLDSTYSIMDFHHSLYINKKDDFGDKSVHVSSFTNTPIEDIDRNVLRKNVKSKIDARSHIIE